MSVEIRGASDSGLAALRRAFEQYVASHDEAQVTLFRHDGYSIWIRVIDPSLQQLSRGDRHELLWNVMVDVPDEIVSDVSILLPLTPKENTASIMSREFDLPVAIEPTALRDTA